MTKILRYYSRKDIQRELIKIAKDREIGVRYGDVFGKRPDILQFESDITELARQGATSFHVSVERWKNPLDLKSGSTRRQLDDLRKGFELILDIDSKFVEYSKLTAELVVEALKFNNIQNIGLKFSGGSGFHILIPFESFPQEVNKIETRLLFPEAPKAIADYIKNLIKPHLKTQILELSTLDEISKSTSIPVKELKENNEFNPFKLVDIDPKLISSRHMIRASAAINEKTGLVSVPISLTKIKQFNLKNAKIENVEIEHSFFNPEKSELEEAKQLFVQAFDFNLKKQKVKKVSYKNYELPKIEIQEKFFPQCISKLLGGVKEDGRKRSVFVLIGFLQHMGWGYDKIQKTLLKWNEKNYEQLRDGYIISQVNWFRKQAKKILPPNCDHEAYYKTLGVYCNNCKCKNPVNFVNIRIKNLKNVKSKGNRRKLASKS